jgi:hypothetical protein
MVANGNSTGSDPCRIFTPRYYNEFKPLTGFVSYPAISEQGFGAFEVSPQSLGSVVADSNRHLMAVVASQSEALCGRWQINENLQEGLIDWIDGQVSNRIYHYERTVGNSALEAQLFFPIDAYADFDNLEDIKVLQCSLPFENATDSDCQSIPLSNFDIYPVDSALIVDVTVEEETDYITLHSGELVNNDEAFIHNFRVGPVPLTDVLRIESEIIGTMRVYNASGQMILLKSKEGRILNVQTSAWPSGIYYIQLTGKNRDYTAKVVK